ncbi:TonB-dependent receptor [Parahaliea maris]|uniref:TonB-dependent receptor n=1 Tax=Parahaliea maris TaxID=2716870 RepID=A0A5C9A7M9_9GAMM|nr:TonB-dependent receptor [Parahaliea maris]TXS96748.1 TonB-dependent receptor [Parahaliea maris]
MKPLSKLSAIAVGLLVAHGASAQQLEEVVVTATKRAESLQDVPISMVAMSGESIQEMNITRGEDFAVDMPAVTIAQNPIGNFIFIRGIGTPGANQGMEQSVSIFHDGIYMGRHQLSRSPFMDLERVEVLRGPQSILFGKNTIGGAISLITAKPTQELEGMVNATYGSYGEKELNGYLSGPITDTLSGRISARGYETDGYLDNVITGDDEPSREDTTVRVQLAWDATDNLTVTGKWENSQFDASGTTSQLSTFNPFNAGAQGFSDLNQALVAAATGGNGLEKYDDERAVVNDGGELLGQVLPVFAGLPGFPDLEEGNTNEMDIGTLTLDWGMGDHTLTAITGYAQYEYRDICDCDFAALPLTQADAREDYDQFSQEIRLTSPGGEKLDYIVGMYYHESDLTYNARDSFGTTMAYQMLGVPSPLLVPNLAREYTMDQEQDMWAVFGSTTYSFTDTTRLTVGLRYFEEEKTAGHVLDKYFGGGWDFSALAGLPAGSIAFGDTPEDYDAFLNGFGSVDLGGITGGQITELIYQQLLGTYEHDIQNRKRKEQDWNWQLTLEHDLTQDIMVFATASTGTKGGGFDGRFLLTTDNPLFEYDEETAENYELGIKAYLLDNTMTFNATAFYSTVEDYQVNIFDGATGFFVQNAAEIESQGVEVDVNWAATEELTVRFAGSYLDASYAEWPNAPCWASPADDVRGGCVDFGTPGAYRDAGGDTNVFSPEWSYNLNFNYVQPVAESLEARFVLNINYADDQFVASDLDPVYAYQESFTKYDLRVALGNVAGDWEVALIGKNLTDERTTTGNANDQPLVAGNGFKLTDRPRSYMIQAMYRF